MTALQPNFDAKKYQGLWYEVARYPMYFDKDTPYQTAKYTLKKGKDGKKYLKVYNRAYNENGSVRADIKGKASAVNVNEPAALRVTFPTSTQKDGEANYLVHSTDYRTYAIVGSYDKESLYILSRERPINKHLYQSLLNYVSALGYDISKLQQDYRSVKK